MLVSIQSRGETLTPARGPLLFLTPLHVSLALKVNSLVGVRDAPRNFALVTGIRSRLAMVRNPHFGRLSDRSTAGMGIRRPWMLVGLACGTVGIFGRRSRTEHLGSPRRVGIAQVFLNALLAAQASVLLPD